MLSQMNHIILFCDDEKNGPDACHLIGSVDPFLQIHLVYNLDQLLRVLETVTPKLIIVYVVGKNEIFSTYVKKLRKEMHLDVIPIYVYTMLPTREEIKTLTDQLLRPK